MRAAIARAARAARFPAIAVVLAFVVGGLVVLLTGNNPFSVYKQLVLGAGLAYPFHGLPGNPLGVDPDIAKFTLVATIVATTPLILAGLCVAFAFRAGLFNIGGTGQFWVGGVTAFVIADRLSGLPGPLLILLAIAGAALGGAVWGAIPGYFKAARGAHEVISTIMLNWVAVYLGQYLFGLDGPLKGPTENPISVDIPDRAKLPGIWGDVQPVHAGIFIALGAAVAFSLIFRRTAFGYDVRAVGFYPEAARAGGVRVGRIIVLAMAVSGLFAGLAGGGEVLGVNYHIASSEFAPLQIGFVGIAVALLGRNTAIGCVLAAFLFGALQSGSNQLQGAFASDLAVPLSQTVQGVIVLLVSAELIGRKLTTRRVARRPAERLPDEGQAPAAP